MNIEKLRRLAVSFDAPGYRGDQIAGWLYHHRVDSIDAMANVPKALRDGLATEYSVGRFAPESVAESADGTKKYLFGARVPDAGVRYVEAVFIPDVDRATLCLSTQVGCARGCRFCMTARQGFRGNLSAGEIVNQYMSIPELERITNIVYLGMGEPLDNIFEVLRSLEAFTSTWGLNLSHKRITVSTAGVIPGLKRLLSHSECHIAVSLHSPFEVERKQLMPIERAYPISEVLETIRATEIEKRRRVSFEYIVFRGVNHSAKHVKELAKILQGIPCRINLIGFHKIPDVDLNPASYDEIVTFQNGLKAKGIPTTIRASRGEDVMAACGLLSTGSIPSG